MKAVLETAASNPENQDRDNLDTLACVAVMSAYADESETQR
jgi:hypothetical protein